MIALSLALIVAAALAHDAFRRHLAADRARFEAARPVPPHEDLVAKVAEMERRLGSIETWAKR